MSKTSDMNSLTELLCQIGPVMELPMLAFHQASAVLTGDSLFTRFEVTRSKAYCGQDVEDELNRVGVSSTGRGFTPGSKEYPYGLLTFYVKASQRRWAEYALRRCKGFNVVTVVDIRNAEWAEGHDGPIPAWSGKRSRMDTAKRRGNFVVPATTAVEPKRGALAVGSGSKLDRFLSWLEGREVKDDGP